MNLIQAILLELLLIFAALGGIFAWRRNLWKQLSLTLAVPVSFVLALLVTKTGILDFSDAIVGLFGSNLGAVAEGSAVTLSLLGYLIRIFIDHFVTGVLFVVFLIITRIAIAIVFGILEGKKKKAEAPEAAKAEADAEAADTAEGTGGSPAKSKWGWLYNAGVVALGVAKGYMIFMFLLLPTVFLLNITTPAVDELSRYAEDEALKEVYVFAEDTVGYLDNTVVMQTAKYTGYRFFNTCASDFLCSDELAGNGGKIYKIEDSSLLPNVVRLGVNGLVAYQDFTATGAISPKLLGAVSEALENLSDMPIIHGVAAEFLATVEPSNEEESAMINDLLLLLQDTYSPENSENLGDDLEELAGLTGYLQGVIEEPLETDDMLNAFMEILADEAKAKELVRYLSATHAFNGGFPYFMGFGINVLGEQMNLLSNKSEHYDKVVAALADILNGTAANIGEIDFAAVEAYIVYVANEGVDPNGYTIADPDNMTERDVQFANYERYMKQMDALRASLYNEAVQKSGEPFTVSFVAADGTVYYYAVDGTAAAWNTTAPDTTVAGNLILHLLLSKTIESNAGVSVENFVAWAGSHTASSLSALYPNLPLATVEGEAAFAAKLASLENFTSATVYTDDILADFEASYNGSFDDDGVAQFAKILTSVAEMMNIIGETDDTEMVNTVINNFSKVGVLLDAINNFGPTAGIPESLLTAIRYSPDFGQYFNINAIDQLVANIESGESTYESLFALIQSIYGLFQEIQ